MIKAVIFDLDGTLLNTLTDISLAMNTVLSKHDFPTHTEQEYCYYVGRGVKNLIISALPGSYSDNEDMVEECRQELKQEYLSHQEENTLAYDGIIDMLKSLQNRDIRLCILSNKPHEMTQKIVASLLGEFKFEHVIGARKGLPVKPDPYGIIEMKRKMNLKAEDFLYVGDTDTDMQTAHAGGLLAVGVEWGFRDRQELEEAGADYVISHPRELLSYIV